MQPACYPLPLLQNKNRTMPVDLKNMPDVSARPASPKFSRWMMVLMILIGFCIVISRLVTGKNNVLLTVGAPAIMLGGLLFILFVIYLLRAISANARDREREQTILKEVRRGRRALQILAAECCTAHSSANKPFTAIGSNLVKNENVFYPQQSWRGEEDTRLSQIARTGGAKEEQHLQALFRALIRKLAQPLSFLPADKSVMVLLEHSSSISEEEAFALFGDALRQSGIQQSVSTLAGSGAQAIDHWLDHHIRSEAVLLVVSWQYAPLNTSMSAEAISGILLGNRLTQDILPPLAFLHRPEAGEGEPDALHYAITQALDWVPVGAEKPEHLWLSGVDAETEAHAALMKGISATGLKNVDPQMGFHNFNDFLGDPGNASLWLAVAGATQSIQQQPAHHLLISRDQQTGKVWNMVVSPASSTKEGEA
ncbi:hypothetical protein F8562_11135 [Klebsiella sp. RCJ4]|nr:hypothetical protein F8562_11135 [Klebsiella sp. RCJ4]MBZ6641621.1 hypothetical protein [Klebsiella michiganensis]MBZ7145889.1 hypothetical protein [Klebsiella michiganensis]MBZ7347971.1 hypothetical protein [Klebsiella michiganensis]MBZ7486596.1 hypothetical protein [Klebsiella michiganensis]